MLVRPKLEYGAIAWNPHTQNNIDTLEKIHRSAVRFIVCMYVFFIRTKYMYNEENTPLCKWNEQQKVK